MNSFTKYFDRKVSHKHLRDVKDANSYTIRYMVGLGSRKVKVIRGGFGASKGFGDTLQQMPPADKYILLSNASNKNDALAEADAVLVNFVITKGQLPGTVHRRTIGTEKVHGLTSDEREALHNQRREEKTMFFKNLLAKELMV